MLYKYINQLTEIERLTFMRLTIVKEHAFIASDFYATKATLSTDIFGQEASFRSSFHFEEMERLFLLC